VLSKIVVETMSGSYFLQQHPVLEAITMHVSFWRLENIPKDFNSKLEKHIFILHVLGEQVKPNKKANETKEKK
jgi:hypothetical protein